MEQRGSAGTPDTSVSIAAIFKAENPYLLEWIEFHRAVGVQYFYLYDNDGGEEAKNLLKPYVEQGIVIRNDWVQYDGTRHDGPTPWKTRNKAHFAFAHAAVHYKHRQDWLMKIDVDEFLVPLDGEDTIGAVLARYDRKRVKGLKIPRINFGDCGHETKPDGLVIESYTKREAVYSDHKDLANCAFLDSNRFCNSSHKWSYAWWKPGKVVKPHAVSGLRVNHYYTKSREEYFSRQNTSRGRPLTEEGFRDKVAGRNGVEDTDLLRFVPAVERALAQG